MAMVSAITNLCCLLAAAATFGIVAFVAAHHGSGYWQFVAFFGLWHAAVYAGIVWA